MVSGEWSIMSYESINYKLFRNASQNYGLLFRTAGTTMQYD